MIAQLGTAGTVLSRASIPRLYAPKNTAAAAIRTLWAGIERKLNGGGDNGYSQLANSASGIQAGQQSGLGRRAGDFGPQRCQLPLVYSVLRIEQDLAIEACLRLHSQMFGQVGMAHLDPADPLADRGEVFFLQVGRQRAVGPGRKVPKLALRRGAG